jgi:hypothetical protein
VAAVCELFFFVATLIAGSTWCPMRAVALPSAGVADACEAEVNETADAATRANKVILICFLHEDLRASDTGRARFGAGRAASRYSQTSCYGGARLDLQNRTALLSGARTAFQIYVLSTTENFPRHKLSLIRQACAAA